MGSWVTNRAVLGSIRCMSKRGSDEDNTGDEADRIATKFKKRLKIDSSEEEDAQESEARESGVDEAPSELTCSAMVLYRPLHLLPSLEAEARVARLLRAKEPSQLAASKRGSHLRLRLDELWPYPASNESAAIGEASENPDSMDID